jgi:metal transporter CNNM
MCPHKLLANIVLMRHCREIIDESDVYIDVHKAIRRLAPAPTYRRAPKGQIVADNDIPKLQGLQESLIVTSDQNSKDSSSGRRQLSVDARTPSQSPANFGSSPKATFMIRRSSAAADGGSVTIRGNATDMREHLKHLGPSNLASRPKTTRYNTVKIKPGVVKDTKDHRTSIHEAPYVYQDDSGMYSAPYGGEGEGLLQSAGKPASDGVLALQQGYGSMDHGSSHRTPSPLQVHKSQQADLDELDKSPSMKGFPSKGSVATPQTPPHRPELRETDSGGTISSLHSGHTSPARRKRGTARSGSITENIVDSNGVRKVVLQTTSSSDGDEAIYSHDGEDGASNRTETPINVDMSEPHSTANGASDGHPDDVKKKTKRRRKRKNHKDAEGSGPNQDA